MGGTRGVLKAAVLAPIMLLVAGLLAILPVQSASAAPGDPFSPNEPTIFVAQGNDFTQLYEAVANPTTGIWEFDATGAPRQYRYNALGFRKADNYLYAIVENNTGTGAFPDLSLIRIGQNGVATNTGFVLPGPTPWSGEFNDDDGYFYVANASGSRYWVIDVSGQTPRLVREMNPANPGENVFDFAFANGYFWGMNSSGIKRINPSNGNAVFFPAPASWNLGSGDYGASWVFGNGNLGFSRNSGTVYQISVTNPGSANPTFNLVSSQPGPSSSRNDGAGIQGRPTDLGIIKNGPARLMPGGKIAYDVAVVNNGPGVSSGWSVRDTLPAGLSNPVVTGDVVSQTLNGTLVVSGGRLGAGETRTFTVNADVADGVDGCLTNAAQVFGNEQDDNASNDTDSTTACVGELEIIKTSDATADSRPGDTVTYTVTATNVGTVDYTAQAPAVVFDDLTGVLDDATFHNDATATRAGTLGYAKPLLSWRGALAVDQSVSISYTITLGQNGDGEVRNVAWVPNDPTDPDPPACDPPTNGRDPVTGEPCAEHEYLLPRLAIAKSADRADLPAVGETVEYTVTVENVGQGDYTATAPAVVTDDLSDVIDDATYNNDAAATVGAAPAYSSPNLSWSGPLTSGETVEITYSVTYTGDGDLKLRNLACVPVTDAAPATPACDLVEIPGAGLSQWKQVSASETPAIAGTVLTYTLFFSNDGSTGATVDAVDNLVHVTDDADVTTEPASAQGLSAVRNGDEIAITGTVPAGETYTVTYRVTVKPDGQRGDDTAANFLLPPGEQPPANPECVPSDLNFPDCTTTPIAAVTYEKSVVASSDPVVAGTVLTYTIEINSTGTVAAPVSRQDVLTELLDDVELTSDPVSDTASVTVSPVEEGRFTMSGTLASGGTATITYEATVKPDSERGDNQADNFLVRPGDDPPTECAADSSQCTSTPIPLIEVAKVADPESGATVEAGDEVTYTLRFHNSGKAAGPVDYTDDLSDVLDDATLIAGPSASNPALTATTGADDTIHVSGTLNPDQTVRIEYTVRVKADGQRENERLGNTLAPTGNPDPECTDFGVACTSHLIPLLESWKQVEADTSPVASGTVLTYTLFFENSGTGAGQVSMVDDLTHVTDDAEVTTEPASADGLDAVRDGNQIAITGAVPAGETYTVTYQVTIKPDADRGDDLAANFLLPPGQQPPTDPVCQPTDAQRPDCTVTPIGRLLTSKAVSADTDPVDVGTVLTYTLTFDNQGEGPVTVDRTDLLSDVLDDAALTQAPVSSDPALSATAIVDDEFRVTGQLAAGRTVTVTYQVTVKPEAERGDNQADNFLVPTGDVPPATCEVDDANCTTTPLPLIEVGKASDPASGSTVVAGQEVTYTLTFRNVGEAAGTVDYSDDLSGVLDDAQIISAPEASDPALSVTSGADGTVRVSGILEAERTVTVSYTVQVNSDSKRGDNQLANVITKTGGGDCFPFEGATCETNHPMPQLKDFKSVNPASGTPVVAGQELTYTLTFFNTGRADGVVDRVDDLTHVLDDADLVGEPSASDAALTVTEDGKRFLIAGTLSPDQTVTVSYTIKIKPNGQRGDDVVANFLLNPDEQPPAEPVCDAEPGEDANCTVNPIGEIVPSKSVNPDSGTVVKAGQTLKYTLKFHNPGKGEATLDYTDHMAGILDDAALVAKPRSSEGVKVVGPVKKALRITGTVQAGQTATVTYSVKVKDYDEQGDHHLGNFLTLTGGKPAKKCLTANPLCTENPIDPPGVDGKPLIPGIPNTGGPFSLLGILAAVPLLIAGGLLMMRSRRRVHA